MVEGGFRGWGWGCQEGFVRGLLRGFRDVGRVVLEEVVVDGMPRFELFL